MLKVNVEKILPLGGSASVQSSEKKVVTVLGLGIYDAQTQHNKDEVVKLTQEVREAHEHIHQDKADVIRMRDEVNQDRIDVQANTDIVLDARIQVVADRDQVRADRETVNEDKNTVANDKAIVISKRIEVGELASQVAADKDTAINQAAIATNQAGIAKTEADRAKSEADRAQEIADGIDVEGGSVHGDLHVTGVITEGGQALSDKYASPAYVLAQVEELKGGASGAYDTLKEIEEALKANDGEIGTITTALGLKADKASPRVTGDLQLREGDYGARVVVASGRIHFQGGNASDSTAAHDMALSGWYGKKLNTLHLHMAEGQNPAVAFPSGTYPIYHGGNKPKWADVGGNEVLDTTTAHLSINNRWLSAANGLGFIPDQANTTGRCSIGTGEWWFANSFVANTFTKSLNVGDEVDNFTIEKQGNDLVFLV